MTARQVSIPSGTTRVLQFEVKYGQDWTVADDRGDPVEADDVTDATFLIKSDLADADGSAVVTKTLGSGITMTDGLASVGLLPDDTDDLEGTYYATLRLYFTSDVYDFEDKDFLDIPYQQITFVRGAVKATS